MITRKYTITIEADEDVVRNKYPHFQHNYPNIETFIQTLLPNSEKSDYGYSIEVSQATLCDTLDITVRIMDYLVNTLHWEPEEEGDPGEWYPWEIQDGIHKLINEALEVTRDEI